MFPGLRINNTENHFPVWFPLNQAKVSNSRNQARVVTFVTITLPLSECTVAGKCHIVEKIIPNTVSIMYIFIVVKNFSPT